MFRKLVLISLIAVSMIVGCSSNPTPVPPPAPTVPIVVTAPTSQPQPTNTAAPVPTTATTVAAKEITIEAWEDYFRPQKVTVTIGTKVTWINLGTKKHNVAYGNLFDQDFNPGDSVSYTFDKPGVYQYYCVQHSLSETEGMVGTITVVAP
ncbi:MAG: cupredoxin domain-containing protein [Chloroflexi bacterium]|nr:cupredoxin domain-containing protein [Chloroflexota bacterium]